jgi:outer membrane immunogenic protein
MRWLVCGLVALGLIEPVAAADYFDDSYLRGSQVYEPGTPVYPRWGRFYAGGQFSYSNGTFDLGQGTESLVSYILRNTAIQTDVIGWTALPKSDTTGIGFGGFIGYNAQWDDVLLGVEFNYSHLSLVDAASDSLSRSFINNAQAPPGHTFTYDVTVAAAASVALTDLATFRARTGWIYDNWMPYGFFGLAVARANVSRSATVSGTLHDLDSTVLPPTTTNSALVFTPSSLTQGQNGVYAFGYAVGTGIEYALMQSLFVRGEWEWVQFPSIKDTKVHLNTVRTAIGFKF